MCVCVCVCVFESATKRKYEKKRMKNSFDFFLVHDELHFSRCFRWTAFCLEHPLPSFFLPSFPSCFSPLFFKKVKKFRFHTQLLPLALFAVLHQKLSKTAKIIKTMREVISLHIGQAGIQTGNSCWELFCLGALDDFFFF